MNGARRFSILLSMLIVLSLCSNALAQPTIYLVRHAEKLSDWPEDKLNQFQPLSEEGNATADRLAERFEQGEIAAIFSSATTRTLHTVFPLSQKLGIEIEIAEACMDTAAIQEFYKELAKRFKSDQAVILVSHSNIIPYLLIKAGLPKKCRNEIGITSSTEHAWLLIEGYDQIWRIDRFDKKKKSCGDFIRTKF